MTQILRILGWISIVGGIILGLYFGLKESLLIALGWWISGIVSGILILSFSMMLEYLESLHYYMDELLKRIPAPVEKTTYKPGQNSRASLEKAEGYKMNSLD